MSANVHRNDPCPCGSGRKYKQCHGRAGATLTRPVNLPLWGLVGIVVVVGGAGAMLFQAAQGPRTDSATLQAPLGAALPNVGGMPGGATAPAAGVTNPAPYQYDPRTNRYWDPTHNHWHNGTPPDSTARPATTTTTITPANAASANTKNAVTAPAPEPFAYNATTNQYWSPKHGHWHNGRPPIDSLRARGLPLDAARADAPAAASAPAAPVLQIPAPADTGR